ncbi:trypsin-like peptidase domain-containing protein [Streptomyces sp. NPDC051572]|uniref:S1C family serine protease n=1 Tax=Streptomyces sp. NPDC051572 TaxID=3155802 RepID=UPI003450E455
MDEGTPGQGPAKTKWWARGRGPAIPGTAEAEDAAPEPFGDAGIRVRGVGIDGDAAADTQGVGDTDGDFALRPPGASRVAGDGDFELRPPVEGLSGEVASGGGDFEAGRPVVGGVADGAVVGTGGDAEVGLPAAEPPTPPGAVVPPTDRPTPLHDPDPYSTPPYGEPGPWAAAPPVQHPGGAPASEVAPQASTAAPGSPVTSAPHSAPASAGDPASAFADTVLPGTSAAPVSDTLTSPSTPATNPWHRYDPWASPAPLKQAATPERQRSRTRKLLAASALALALLSGGIGGVVGAHLERDGIGGGIVLPQAGEEDSQRAPGSVAGIAARALPSVVTLHVTGDEESGTGTGIVLDTRGHILTNNHVVESAGGDGRISVSFSGGQTVKGKVVGRDTGYDLAVVQVRGVRGLTPMPLGNSDNVRVGDPVVAIGAPFDLDNTVTSGIISAKERPITAGGEASDGSDVSYVDALQTDAPINPGNSGGPLLDAQGRLVGVNSAIRSADDGVGDGTESGQAGSIGLGFAIPVNQAKRVAEELINTGKATHPVIGVTLDMEYAGDGARVATKGSGDGPAVIPGGPGAKAGLRAGDVITQVDGERVHSGNELIVRTRAHRPGDHLRLTLRRGGKDMTLSLVLGSATGD